MRVAQAGICNTDLEIMRGYLPFKGILGHEFVGVVEKVHTRQNEGWLGKRVVGEINVACGECERCKRNMPSQCANRTTLGIRAHDGAFADFLRLPLVNLHEVPPTVSDRQAVFTEPLAAACQILEQVHVLPTDKVVVIGDGKLGLLIAQVLRLTGADLSVIGRHAVKGAILQKQGIKFLESAGDMSPEQGREMLGTECDVVVECTGNQAGLEIAKALIRPRGTLVLKSTYHGTPAVPLSSYVVDEIKVVGSRCGPFGAALRLLERSLIDVESLISFEFPLLEAKTAFSQAFGKGNLKIILKMTNL